MIKRLVKKELIEKEILEVLKDGPKTFKEVSAVISDKYGVSKSYISEIKSELEAKGKIKCEVNGRTKVLMLNREIKALVYLIPIAALISAIIAMNIPMSYFYPSGDTVHALGDNVKIVYVPFIPKNVLIGVLMIGVAIGYFVSLFVNRS